MAAANANRHSQAQSAPTSDGSAMRTSLPALWLLVPSSMAESMRRRLKRGGRSKLTGA